MDYYYRQTVMDYYYYRFNPLFPLIRPGLIVVVFPAVRSLLSVLVKLKNWHLKECTIGWNGWKTKEPVFCPWWRQVFSVLNLVCGRKLVNLTLEKSKFVSLLLKFSYPKKFWKGLNTTASKLCMIENCWYTLNF